MQYEFLNINTTGSQRTFGIVQNDRRLSFAEVISGWRDKPDFCERYTTFLRASLNNTGCFWEHPPISEVTLTTPYECTLMLTGSFSGVRENPAAFSAHFTGNEVVSFSNLRGDAILVVPAPISEAADYAHFARFVQTAPDHQILNLWRLLAVQLDLLLPQRKVYLSTAGHGVSWLHLRLDSRPKYYRNRSYAGR